MARAELYISCFIFLIHAHSTTCSFNFMTDNGIDYLFWAVSLQNSSSLKWPFQRNAVIIVQNILLVKQEKKAQHSSNTCKYGCKHAKKISKLPTMFKWNFIQQNLLTHALKKIRLIIRCDQTILESTWQLEQHGKKRKNYILFSE